MNEAEIRSRVTELLTSSISRQPIRNLKNEMLSYVEKSLESLVDEGTLPVEDHRIAKRNLHGMLDNLYSVSAAQVWIENQWLDSKRDRENLVTYFPSEPARKRFYKLQQIRGRRDNVVETLRKRSPDVMDTTELSDAVRTEFPTAHDYITSHLEARQSESDPTKKVAPPQRIVNLLGGVTQDKLASLQNSHARQGEEQAIEDLRNDISKYRTLKFTEFQADVLYD